MLRYLKGGVGLSRLGVSVGGLTEVVLCVVLTLDSQRCDGESGVGQGSKSVVGRAGEGGHCAVCEIGRTHATSDSATQYHLKFKH
jgi:hypothetical protein